MKILADFFNTIAPKETPTVVAPDIPKAVLRMRRDL
jgi:hypothetical protein